MTQILNRHTGSVITEGEMNLRELVLHYAKSEKKAGRSADLSYADLSSADLRYADLSSADLRSADLRYADLRYANLNGEKFQKYFSIGPIGSRNDYLQVFITEKQTIVQTGCFRGTLNDLASKTDRKDYQAAIQMVYAMSVIESNNIVEAKP